MTEGQYQREMAALAKDRERLNRDVARMLDRAVDACTEAQFSAVEELLVVYLMKRAGAEAREPIAWFRECFAEARALKKARAAS